MTPFFPHNSSSASELRSAQVARALQEFGTVKVLLVGASDGHSQAATTAVRDFEIVDNVTVGRFPNSGLARKMNWVLNPRSPLPHGVAADEPELQRALLAAGQHDVIWFFKLRTANSFLRRVWPRSVVDVDDIPSTFEASVLDTQEDARARFLTSVRLWSWKRREKLLGERFTVSAVCSEDDRAYLRNLGTKGPIRIIPNGYERPSAPPMRRVASPPRVGFIGIFDHGPNLEGIRWFIRHCWPTITNSVPGVRLRLVGRSSDGPLVPKEENIDALGWVDDPAEEIATWTSMIVPLHVGAGTRGKIAHAFSQKCPVVSTALGAYGYDVSDGYDIFIADTAEGFAEACLRAIRDPEEAVAMAERAWGSFLDKWTWDAIRPNVGAAIEDCLRVGQRTA